MKNLFARFIKEDEGQDLIEYALLAALIAVACITAVRLIGTDANGIFGKVTAALGGV
jgi:pilus assembly protein Flp/PilA